MTAANRNCPCHPWTDEDRQIWPLAKATPRTPAQWARLHDLIEQEKRSLIEDYKRTHPIEVEGLNR